MAQWLTTHWRGRSLPPEMPWQAFCDRLGSQKGVTEADVPLDGMGPWPEATPLVS